MEALVERLAGPHGRADRSGRTEPDAAGDLAARPAAGLAPPRGQVDVVGIPPADGPDARGARRRGRPDRPPRADRPVEDEQQGQADLALPVPGPGLRPRPGRGHTTRPRSRLARTTSRSDGRSATTRASTRRTDGGPEACRRPSRIPGRSSRSHWIRTKDHQGACSTSGAGSPTTASRRPDRPAPARDLLPAPPRVGQWLDEPCARPDESALEAARRLATALDRTTLAIQGPPGSGKTYTGARMIVHAGRRRQAGRDHGDQPQGHRQLPEGGPRGGRDRSGVGVRPVQKRRQRTRCSTTRGSTRCKDATRRPRRASRRPGERRRPGRPGCGRRRRWPSRSTSCSSTRPARSRWRTWSPIAGATDSLVLLGDPQQLDQPLKGTHPPGADRSALAHVLGDARHDAADAGLFLETTWRLHPDLCAFTSEVFYDDRLEPEPHLVVQRVDGRPGRRRRHRPAAARRADGGADNESPDEAEAVAELVRSTRRRRRRRGPIGRGRPAGRAGRHPDRRAVQRPGRRDRGAGCRPRPASGRSTSSRARRRRSASTR